MQSEIDKLAEQLNVKVSGDIPEQLGILRGAIAERQKQLRTIDEAVGGLERTIQADKVAEIWQRGASSEVLQARQRAQQKA